MKSQLAYQLQVEGRCMEVQRVCNTTQTRDFMRASISVQRSQSEVYIIRTRHRVLRARSSVVRGKWIGRQLNLIRYGVINSKLFPIFSQVMALTWFSMFGMFGSFIGAHSFSSSFVANPRLITRPWMMLKPRRASITALQYVSTYKFNRVSRVPTAHLPPFRPQLVRHRRLRGFSKVSRETRSPQVMLPIPEGGSPYSIRLLNYCSTTG